MSDGPETPEQAHNFEKMHAEGVRRGLCGRCASQAAYGRVHGFNAVHAPCVTCAVTVATWPTAKANGWRLYELRARSRGAHKVAVVPVALEAGAPTTGEAVRLPEGVRRGAA